MRYEEFDTPRGNPNENASRKAFWITHCYKDDISEEQARSAFEIDTRPMLITWLKDGPGLVTRGTGKVSHAVEMQCQVEVCPDTGRPHYHCYIEFDNEVSGITLRNHLMFYKVDALAAAKLCMPHFGITKGRDAIQFRVYCSKERTRSAIAADLAIHVEKPGPVETIQQSHKRREVVDWIAEFNKGKVPFDILTEHPSEQPKISAMAQCFTLWQQNLKTEHVVPTMDVRVYYGNSGVGKTASVMGYCEYLRRNNIPYFKITSSMMDRPKGKLWWDWYKGEKILVIEEFECWIELNQLKNILDPGTMLLQTKTKTHVMKNWNVILMATNMPMERWYADEIAADFPSTTVYEQLWRRINHFYHVKIDIVDGERVYHTTELPLPMRQYITKRKDELEFLAEYFRVNPEMASALPFADDAARVACLAALDILSPPPVEEVRVDPPIDDIINSVHASMINQE